MCYLTVAICSYYGVLVLTDFRRISPSRRSNQCTRTYIHGSRVDSPIMITACFSLSRTPPMIVQSPHLYCDSSIACSDYAILELPLRLLSFEASFSDIMPDLATTCLRVICEVEHIAWILNPSPRHVPHWRCWQCCKDFSYKRLAAMLDDKWNQRYSVPWPGWDAKSHQFLFAVICSIHPGCPIFCRPCLKAECTGGNGGVKSWLPYLMWRPIFFLCNTFA